MLRNEALKDLLHQPKLSRLDKLLLCLAVDASAAKAIKDVRTLASGAGLRAALKWNISDILGKSSGLAVLTPGGWELTSPGRDKVEKLTGGTPSPAARIASSLRAELSRITDPVIAGFVEEAIRCVELKVYRAAAVLSWVGALSLLHAHVVQNALKNFNAEATRRNVNWKPAKTTDDLTTMNEHEFLQILGALSILGKSVRHELEVCLKLRNGCGHPSSLQLSENRVAAHVETLLLNVFAKF